MIPRSTNKRRKKEDILHNWEQETEEEMESFSMIQQEIEALLADEEVRQYDNQKPSQEVIFSGTQLLHGDLDEHIKTLHQLPMIHICAYHINKEAKVPFLQYFLHKQKKEDGTMHFPRFLFSKNINIIQKCLDCMNVLCSYFYKKVIYKYEGYIMHEGDIFLFFDCSEFKIETVSLSQENEIWLVAIDEIINTKYVCDIPMDPCVVSFFEEYRDCLYLTNPQGEIYETPTIVYASCPVKRIDFYSTFGVPYTHESVDGQLPGYYFKNSYETAISTVDTATMDTDKTKIGILRVALFLQNLYIGTQNEWKQEYDSLYIGPDYIIKEYEQQYVLSSQWIYRKQG